jgi:hypothetical protein
MTCTLNYKPTKEEVKFIATNLQKEEVDELDIFMTSPSHAILDSVEMSHGTATVISPDGLPIAILGVVPMDDDSGMLWVMSTEKVKAHSLGFFRCVKKLVEEQCALFGRVVSYVDIDSPAHQKFTAALGLTLTSEVLTNADNDRQYLVFEMITTKGLDELFYKSENIDYYRKLHNIK